MSLLRLAVLLAVALLVCGGFGTLAGVLAALPFHGATRYVVWGVTGTTVASGLSYLLDRTAEKKGWL